MSRGRCSVFALTVHHVCRRDVFGSECRETERRPVSRGTSGCDHVIEVKVLWVYTAQYLLYRLDKVLFSIDWIHDVNSGPPVGER